VEKAEAAVAQRPADLIAFFVPGTGLHGRRMRQAFASGERWCELPRSANWVPAVATCWPAALAAEFVPFAEDYVGRRLARRLSTVGDDPVIGKFARSAGLSVWATVPSLVEHPDVGWSLVKGREYEGTNPARRAAVYSA
jgi:hypothetical protein